MSILIDLSPFLVDLDHLDLFMIDFDFIRVLKSLNLGRNSFLGSIIRWLYLSEPIFSTHFFAIQENSLHAMFIKTIFCA